MRLSPFISCCCRPAIGKGNLKLASRIGVELAESSEICFLSQNLVTSFPYKISESLSGLWLRGNMKSEHAVIRAKQVAQECGMKASYYRREFTQRAWREAFAAALLIPLGLILCLRAPAAGLIIFVLGAVAARGAYLSFQYACSAYGEYNELREDHN